MKLFVLNQQNSIANHFLAELRDVTIQNDRLRFRRNLERLGEMLAYETSKYLSYKSKSIQTPLATTETGLLEAQPVLITILRAGLPFFQGFSNYYDRADSGFIGAYRAPHKSAADLTVDMTYMTAPKTEGKCVIVIDPMLATGKSMIKAIDAIRQHGKPKHIFIASVIAAPEGINYLQQHLKNNHSIFTCALDEQLDKNAYIVPGLGDAGDLSYGQKI